MDNNIKTLPLAIKLDLEAAENCLASKPPK